MASSEALPQIPAVELNNFLSRLESRPKPLLSHEFGVGSPCNRCDCPGLDLHFWRKMCKVCSCRLDEHDILPLDGQQDHGAVVTRRLFGANKQQPPLGSHGIDKANSEAAAGDEWLIGRLKLEEGKENSHRRRQQQQQGIGKEESSRQEDKDSNSNYGIRLMDRPPVKLPPRAAVVVPPPPPTNVRQLDFAAPSSVIYENTAALWREGEVGHRPEDWAWTPAGDWRLAQRYLLSLAEGERPLKGSDGAQLRRQRLAQQLPDHDSDVAASKAGRGPPREVEMHREFVELVKREVVGIAEVVDYGHHKAQFADKLPAGNGKGTEEFQCRKCADKFCQPDVGLVTDHERESAEAIWHPRCFNCSVCGQLLVDLLYFFHGGKYFCGRHFGEKLYPRCAGCDELIFAREYTFAEEKSWHLEHFCCFGCDQHLSGQRYVVKEDQPFCVDCYLAKFARTCATCCNKIAPFDQRVTYGEIHWHASPQCFKCKSCAKPLSNQKFLLKGEEPFCSSECKVRSGF